MLCHLILSCWIIYFLLYLVFDLSVYISMAIVSHVSRLCRDLADHDHTESDLRARLVDSDARLLAALDENAKLVKERNSLALTAKKMPKNLAKLEAFKKQLKSLSEDSLLQLSETCASRDLDKENNLTARVPSQKDEVSSSHTSSDTSSRSTMTEFAQGFQFSITPYTAPKVTPGSTPIISSSGGSPRASSPKFLSGPTSPTRSLSQGQSTFSSWHESSNHQYSALASPPQRFSFVVQFAFTVYRGDLIVCFAPSNKSVSMTASSLFTSGCSADEEQLHYSHESTESKESIALERHNQKKVSGTGDKKHGSKKKSKLKKSGSTCEMGFLNSTAQFVEPAKNEIFVSFNLEYVEAEKKLVGSEDWEPRFAGHQSLQEREESYLARMEQQLKCAFVKGPNGTSTGFDISEANRKYMSKCHIAVSSCIFGNSHRLRTPFGKTITSLSKKTVCFVVFLDEITLQTLQSEGQKIDDVGFIGIWKIILTEK
ncbi:hypothetical protein ABZP36_024079 [Zizania latifolia]